jgi:hypothetical protein
MRVVHARLSRADFAKRLGEMREWLDRHNRPLVRFETEWATRSPSRFNSTAMIWQNCSGRLSKVFIAIRAANSRREPLASTIVNRVPSRVETARG